MKALRQIGVIGCGVALGLVLCVSIPLIWFAGSAFYEGWTSVDATTTPSRESYTEAERDYRLWVANTATDLTEEINQVDLFMEEFGADESKFLDETWQAGIRQHLGNLGVIAEDIRERGAPERYESFHHDYQKIADPLSAGVEHYLEGIEEIDPDEWDRGATQLRQAGYALGFVSERLEEEFGITVDLER